MRETYWCFRGTMGDWIPPYKIPIPLSLYLHSLLHSVSTSGKIPNMSATPSFTAGVSSHCCKVLTQYCSAPMILSYELASKLLVCGNGGNHLRCPVWFCSGFFISLLIEQPSSLLYNYGNFDPGSYRDSLGVCKDII